MKAMQLLQFFLVLAVALLVAPLSAADNHMRCGTKLVSVGDTKAEVLLTCGEPLTKETIAVGEQTERSEFRAKYPLLVKHGLLNRGGGSGSLERESSVTFPIDQWTYNIGTGKFLRILIFQGGRLAVIEKGDRM